MTLTRPRSRSAGPELTITGVADGTAAITVTATDPGGLSVTQAFAATVVSGNRVPEAVGEIPAQTVAPGDSVTVDVSGNFTDPDGDDLDLTFTAASDDTNTATVEVSGPELTITGVADGTAAITVTATDPGGLSVTQAFAATVGAPPNQAPQVAAAIADRTIHAGASERVNVSGNFTDPDGDDLDLTFAAMSSDTNMAKVLVSESTLLIIGVADGAATITVTATDPDQASVADTFDVTVGNRAPEVSDTSDTIADQHIATPPGFKILDVSGNFTDPDGDDLTFTAVSNNGGIATVGVSGSELTITGVAATGETTITVTATDGDGEFVTDEFVVTVGNRAPEAEDSIPDQSVVQGTSITLDVSSYFTDPDGDALTFTATSTNGGIATVGVHESVLTIFGAAAGTATITVTATDPDQAIVTDEFVVTVGNRAPEVSDSIADQHIATPPGFKILDVSGNFSDPDGDSLTFTAVSSNTSAATVEVSGSELTIIVVAATGETTITVTATDPDQASVADEFVVTVGNRAPEAEDSIPDQTVVQGTIMTLDVESYFSDADGDVLTFTAVSSNAGIAAVGVDGSVLTITGVVVGETTIRVTATDGGSLTAQGMFRVEVTAPGD